MWLWSLAGGTAVAALAVAGALFAEAPRWSVPFIAVSLGLLALATGVTWGPLLARRLPVPLPRRDEEMATLKRDYQQAMLARLDAEQRVAGLTTELRELRDPPPADAPAPELDERSVIEFRRYGRPAYEALRELLRAVMGECFERGGWYGLSARLMKDHVIAPADEAAERVSECIDGTRNTRLEQEFSSFYDDYSYLMALAYHFGSRDTVLKPNLLAEWVQRDRAFEKELLDLAAGVNRSELAGLTMLGNEPRDLLRSLHEAQRSTPRPSEDEG